MTPDQINVAIKIGLLLFGASCFVGMLVLGLERKTGPRCANCQLFIPSKSTCGLTDRFTTRGSLCDKWESTFGRSS